MLRGLPPSATPQALLTLLASAFPDVSQRPQLIYLEHGKIR